MTSVVDTSVKFFGSSMSGASVMNGVAGSHVGVLDACLRDGFDVKVPASIVVAGGVCTITWVGTHSAQVDSVILLSGITDAGLTGLNGEQKVVAKTATTLAFATAAANGTVAAPGSCSFKMAPLGWTTPYSGTNLRVYQSADVTGTQRCLRVDDTGTTSVRVVGYESMSDVNTGIGPFPSAAQVSGGGYWPKSNAASATAVPWFVIGDSKIFYIWVAPAFATNAASVQGWTRFFGDGLFNKPSGDPFGATLCCSYQSSIVSMSDGDLEGNNSAAIAATFSPRSFVGVGSPVAQNNLVYGSSVGTSMSGVDATYGAFPSQIDGQLKLSKKHVALGINAPPRLELPGVYHALQQGIFDYFKTGDTTPGAGVLAGRSLRVVNCGNPSITSAAISTNTGGIFFDVTGPWR